MSSIGNILFNFSNAVNASLSRLIRMFPEFLAAVCPYFVSGFTMSTLYLINFLYYPYKLRNYESDFKFCGSLNSTMAFTFSGLIPSLITMNPRN